MHGVTLLVMPALIFASGTNEVGLLRTCHRELIKTNPPPLSAVYMYS